MNMTITFAQLDGQLGSVDRAKSALDSWYDSVRHVPVNDLTDDDLGRSLRQQIHLVHVIPVTLTRLASDPLAGHQYDGELMSCLARIPDEFWKTHRDLAGMAAELMTQFRDRLCNDVQKLVDDFLRDYRLQAP